MGNAKERFNEIKQLMNTLEKETKNKVGIWRKFSNSFDYNLLPEKYVHLIALVAGMVKSCKWCITFHVRAALDCGASKEEILEACWVAVEMDGGPALVHIIPVLETIKEFSN